MNTQASLTSRVGVLEMEVQLALSKAGAPPIIALAGNVTGPSNANRVVGLSGDSVTKIVALDSGASIKQTQSNAAVAETALIMQPLSPKPDGLTKASFAFRQTSALFNATYDETCDWGYNVRDDQPLLPTARYSIESDYEFLPGQHQMEMHGQFSSLGGGGGQTFRWISSIFKAYGSLRGDSFIQWRDGTVGPSDPGAVTIGEVNAGVATLAIATVGVLMQTNGFANLIARGVWTVTGDVQPSPLADANNMTFSPQRANPGAAIAHGQAGRFTVDLGAPVAGAAETTFDITRAGAPLAAMAVRADGTMTLINNVLAGSAQISLFANAGGGSRQIIFSGPAATSFLSNNNGALQVTATTGVYLLAGAGDQCHFFVAGAELGQIAANGVANQTALVIACDVGNVLNRVTLGAADSGGVGFRVMRVPN